MLLIHQISGAKKGHHDPQSLTHSVALEVGAGLAATGHTFEFADLAAEGYQHVDGAVRMGQFTANKLIAELA